MDSKTGVFAVFYQELLLINWRGYKFVMQHTCTPVKKERLTAQLPIELIERARNAVYWTPGLTLAGLAQEALEQFLDQMENERGEPFPPRPAPLKTGRPLK